MAFFKAGRDVDSERSPGASRPNLIPSGYLCIGVCIIGARSQHVRTRPRDLVIGFDCFQIHLGGTQRGTKSPNTRELSRPQRIFVVSFFRCERRREKDGASMAPPASRRQRVVSIHTMNSTTAVDHELQIE